jgi:probable HAF family extracellular repeat protein
MKEMKKMKMFSRTSPWIAARRTAATGLAALLLAAAFPAAAQVYTVTKLAGLSTAAAINSSAEVVGTGIVNFRQERAFLWTQAGGAQNLGSLFSGGDAASWATAINDKGHVTGGSWISQDDNAAFLWTPGLGMQPIVFVALASGGVSINIADEVVGDGFETTLPTTAFVWTSQGGVTYPALFGSSISGASGVNDKAQVVGWFLPPGGSGDEAFLWREAQGAQDLGASIAAAISSNSEVVGSNFAGHAFLWTESGGMQDLGTLPGDSSSGGAAINSAGVVVGTSSAGDQSRAFLWSQSAGMQDLNTLIPANSGWSLQSATGINVHGQIVGNGQLNGNYVAFLLTPLSHGGLDQ